MTGISKFERKIRIYFECYKNEIDIDDLELIRESKIVKGVLIFPQKRRPRPRFQDLRDFNTKKERVKDDEP